MTVSAISIIVQDSPAAARGLADCFGWPLGPVFDGFAEVNTGSLLLWLSTGAAVPGGQVDGLTIHHILEDPSQVDPVVAQAVAAGAQVVFGPTDTDYGMRSAVLRVPGCGVLGVDVCAALPAS